MSLRGGLAVNGRAGSAVQQALAPTVLVLVTAAWVVLVGAQLTGTRPSCTSTADPWPPCRRCWP